MSFRSVSITAVGFFVAVVGYFIISRSISYQNQDAPVVERKTTNTAKTDPPKSEWAGKIEVASGGGFRGAWRMNESEFHYVDDPTVALSEDGTIGVAWANQSRKDIFFQLYEPDRKPRFSEPINVSQSPNIFSWLPRMVFGTDDANRVYIIWQEIVFSGGSHGGEIFFGRSIDGGRTFSNPINLSNTTAGDGKGRLTMNHWHNGSLDIAIGPANNIYVVWTEYEGALRFTRSLDGGMSFSAPIHIAGGGIAAPARGPSLAVSEKGIVYLSWSETKGRTGNIYFTKSVNQGRTFGKPALLFEGDGHADAPKIAVDGQGIIHLVYAESPSGLWGPYHIRYSRSSDDGQTFEKPRDISLGADTNASFPSLGIDGEDNIYVIWEIFPERARHSRGLGFTFSNNGGQTFESPLVIPGSADSALGVNGSQQGLLMNKLAVNKAGAVAVVNSTFLANEKSHIWLHFREAASS